MNQDRSKPTLTGSRSTSRWAARFEIAEKFFAPEEIESRLYADWSARWHRADSSDATPSIGFHKLHVQRAWHHVNGSDPIRFPNNDKLAKIAVGILAGGLVCLLGGRGSGKTQAMALLCGMKGIEAVYMQANDLAGWIKTWIGIGGLAFQQNVRQLQLCPLLILDDIHDLAFTEFEGRTLIGILNARYAERRPSVLISNDATVEQLANRIGSTLIDRTKEFGSVVVFDWPSYRGRTP